MIKIKTLEEIELMRESALIVSKTLGMLASEVKPGVTTLQLDGMAETFKGPRGRSRILGIVRFSQFLVHESQCPSGTWNTQQHSFG